MKANYFSDQKKGDTFNGRKITMKRDEMPIDLTGVSILMQFKLNNVGKSRFEFSTANNTITLPNPTAGEMLMMPRLLDVIAGTYSYDLQITFPNGNVKTYLSGKWNITADVSR